MNGGAAACRKLELAWRLGEFAHSSFLWWQANVEWQGGEVRLVTLYRDNTSTPWGNASRRMVIMCAL